MKGPAPPASDGRRTALVALALVVAAACVYGRSAGFGFVLFDDDQYVYENEWVRRGLTWEGLGHFLVHPHSINWHPVTSLSHMLDVELWGLRAGGHHATSVALHALASVLLLLAVRSLTGAFWPSALVAGLFCVHPLRVESVAWVSERKDVLAGVFLALTLLAYARYARRPGAWRYALVTLCFALGLASKPVLVTAPFLLLLLDAWPLGRWRGSGGDRSLGGLLVEKAPWLALSAAASAVTLAVQTSSGAVLSLRSLAPAERVAGALTAYVQYVAKTVWPTGLAFFHPHPAIVAPEAFEPFSATTVACALLLVLASALAVVLFRRSPWLAVGWFWYLGTLVPVIGLVQVGEQAWAERYAHLSTVGIYLAAAFGLRELVRARPAAAGPAAVASLTALALLGARAWFQVGTWRDGRTLLEHALAVTRRNYVAWNNLGLIELEDGRSDRARAAFEEALAIRPGDVKARVNLAIARASAGDLEAARSDLEAVVREHPGLAEAHASLASVLGRQGRLAEALPHFERALEIEPDDAGTLANLGLLRLRLGDAAAAVEALERAVALRPDRAGTRLSLARACELAGRPAAALEHYERALELAPEELAPEHRRRLELLRRDRGGG